MCACHVYFTINLLTGSLRTPGPPWPCSYTPRPLITRGSYVRNIRCRRRAYSSGRYTTERQRGRGRGHEGGCGWWAWSVVREMWPGQLMMFTRTACAQSPSRERRSMAATNSDRPTDRCHALRDVGSSARSDTALQSDSAVTSRRNGMSRLLLKMSFNLRFKSSLPLLRVYTFFCHFSFWIVLYIYCVLSVVNVTGWSRAPRGNNTTRFL